MDGQLQVASLAASHRYAHANAVFGEIDDTRSCKQIDVPFGAAFCVQPAVGLVWMPRRISSLCGSVYLLPCLCRNGSFVAPSWPVPTHSCRTLQELVRCSARWESGSSFASLLGSSKRSGKLATFELQRETALEGTANGDDFVVGDINTTLPRRLKSLCAGIADLPRQIAWIEMVHNALWKHIKVGVNLRKQGTLHQELRTLV